MVKVEEAGVEICPGSSFDHLFQLGELAGPRQRGFGGSGIGVVEPGIAIPRDHPGGDDGFAKHLDHVVLPGDFRPEPAEEVVGFSALED